jgi:hypothetical protein
LWRIEMSIHNLLVVEHFQTAYYPWQPAEQ